MRSVICRCPNHSRCTVGYRGDDIEVVEGMVPVCPECGTALQPKPRGRNQMLPLVINILTIAAFTVGAWFAWPKIVQFWFWLTKSAS